MQWAILVYVASSLASFVVLLALAGCAGGVGNLAPPSPRLMQSPPPLKDTSAGEDAIKLLADQRRSYTQCSSRLKGLQRYVKAAGE